MAGSPPRDDRVRPLTRAVALGVVPFLLVAVAVLYPVPTDTQRLFAWPIKPTMTAMTLGSAYLGGAYFFVRAGRASAWHTVKAGFLPVGLFASLMGVATVIHWDRFSHDRLAFWLWTLLYATTPFLVFAVYWRNRRHAPPAVDGELLEPVPVAWAIASVGVLAVASGVFLFAVPERAASIWPWPLTALTARVLGAIMCLGLAGVGALVDRRWSSARIPLQVAAIMLVLFVVAGVRAHAEFDGGRVLTWLFVAGFGGALAAVVVLYAWMEARVKT
jgi:hypothetical protein